MSCCDTSLSTLFEPFSSLKNAYHEYLSRSPIIRQFLQKRQNIEEEYAKKLLSLSNCQLPVMASDCFGVFNSCMLRLISAIKTEVQSAQKLSTVLFDAIQRILKFESELVITSGTLSSADQAIKDLTSLMKVLNHKKGELDAKNTQCWNCETEWLIARIGEGGLEKTSKLNLKVLNFREDVGKLLNQYDQLTEKYSTKLKVHSENIEKAEKNIKSSLTHGLLSICQSALAVVKDDTNDISNVIGIEDKKYSTSSIFENLSVPSVPKQCFLDILVEKFQHNRLDKIMRYAQNADLRSRLIRVLESKDESFPFQEAAHLEAKTVTMVQNLKRLIRGSCLPDEAMLQQMRMLMLNNQTGRMDLIVCLQNKRLNRQNEVNDSWLNVVVPCIKVFLDLCLAEYDTYTSKKLLVLAMTYFTKEGDRQVYLWQQIKNHSIWAEIQWWEAAFIESVYEEHKVSRKPPHTIKDFHLKLPNFEKEDPPQKLFQQVYFSNMAFYIENMRLTPGVCELAKNFATKFSSIIELDQLMADEIMRLATK